MFGPFFRELRIGSRSPPTLKGSGGGGVKISKASRVNKIIKSGNFFCNIHHVQSLILRA